MKRRKLTSMTLAVVLLILSFAFSSCGPVQSYWGVHSEYCTDGDYHHHHKPPKKKKHKKHKKHKKYKKHKHHHQDWDD